MMEKTTTMKKDKKNTVWKIGTIVFAVLFIIALFWSPFRGEATREDVDEPEGDDVLQKEMCSSIRGTPAWADSEGDIIGYGYNETYLVEDLIENKVYLLYHPGCGWCQKQIDYFGESWQKYVDSGYTIDCSEN